MAHAAHGLFIVMVVLAGVVGPAQGARQRLATPAAPIIVNRLLETVDPQQCRLRDAIVAANTNAPVNGCQAGSAGADSITFHLSSICNVVQCTLVLAGPLPAITDTLTINGSPYGVEISGQHLYQAFDLGVVTLTLSNLKLDNGSSDTIGGAIHMAGTTLTVKNVYFSANQAQFNGGAIDEVSGTLVVYNSAFAGNSSALGGAIAQVGGSATISESTFSANTGGNGGAIGLISTSALHVTDSVFDGNSASVWGGAMYLQDQSVQATINNSTFSHNQALTTTAFYGGGAIRLDKGTLTLANSTLVSNTSNALAGALNILGGQATLTNLTISGNSARRSGGGLYVQSDGVSSPASVTLNNATITGNTADSDNNDDGDGGGIRAQSGTVAVRNSIIALNFDTPGNSAAGSVQPDCSGIFDTPAYNLIGRNDGCVGLVDGSNGNQVGSAGSPLDPLLAPLADNDGPTLTQALLPASPAINAGNPLAPGSGGLACVAADQRGVARPLGIRCDLGAYEAGVRVFLALVRR